MSLEISSQSTHHMQLVPMGKKVYHRRVHFFVPLSILPPWLITAKQSARSEQTMLKAKDCQYKFVDAVEMRWICLPLTEWNALT